MQEDTNPLAFLHEQQKSDDEAEDGPVLGIEDDLF